MLEVINCVITKSTHTYYATYSRSNRRSRATSIDAAHRYSTTAANSICKTDQLQGLFLAGRIYTIFVLFLGTRTRGDHLGVRRGNR